MAGRRRKMAGREEGDLRGLEDGRGRGGRGPPPPGARRRGERAMPLGRIQAAARRSDHSVHRPNTNQTVSPAYALRCI